MKWEPILSNLTSEEDKIVLPWELKKMAEIWKMGLGKGLEWGVESSRHRKYPCKCLVVGGKMGKWKKYREPLGFPCS